MKRVLQISKYMYPFIGGIEQVVRDMAHVLAMAGVEQKIICFNEDTSDGNIITHRNETLYDMVDGIQVVRCGCVAKISSQSISLNYHKELKKLINDFKPDIVIFPYPNPFVAHFLLKYRNKNFKLILYWHLDITKQKILGKVFHGQNIRLINRADKIVGATPKHVNESAYSQYFGEKKQILPYMIDEKNLVISQSEMENSKIIREKYKGKVICFFIGRHVEYKGLRYLIEASGKLKDSNLQFLIAGIGELTEELKILAKNDNKIKFLGKVSDSEKRLYLYACDIICFPSITKNEAFGLALAEGMYYGKPAVTFTISGSGVNFVNIDGLTGIECPNRDSKAYAKALKRLAEDCALRKKYGQAARKRIVDNFTVVQFEENVKNLISYF